VRCHSSAVLDAWTPPFTWQLAAAVQVIKEGGGGGGHATIVMQQISGTRSGKSNKQQHIGLLDARSRL